MKPDVQNEVFLASMKIPEAIAPVKATNELICFYSCRGTFGSLGSIGTIGCVTGTFGSVGSMGTVGTLGCS